MVCLCKMKILTKLQIINYFPPAAKKSESLKGEMYNWEYLGHNNN